MSTEALPESARIPESLAKALNEGNSFSADLGDAVDDVFDQAKEAKIEGLSGVAAVRLFFRSPRKTLRRVLVDATSVEIAEDALARAGVDGGMRPAELDLAAAQRLATAMPEESWR